MKPNDKNSKFPGDGVDMVRARGRFLDSGAYYPLAKRLADIVNESFKDKITLVDAGVGTGYYLKAISSLRGEGDEYIGVDISKEAARLASRGLKGAFIAVASVFDMPIESGSVDAVLSVFSPFADREYFRVLREGGMLLTVSPAEGHLIELRRALYDDVRPVEAHPSSQLFEAARTERLSFKFSLNSKEEISSLLAMTPYMFKTGRDKIQAVQNMDKMELTADFAICAMFKTPQKCALDK